MLFWLIAIALSASLAAIFVAVLIRVGAEPSGDSRREVEFYRLQLAEVEADRERRRLNEEEAAQSVREVSRRLLRAHERAERAGPAGQASRLMTSVACAAVIAVLIPGTLAIYWLIGQPGIPDMPLKARYEAAEEIRANRQSQEEAVRSLGAGSPVPDNEYARLVEELRGRLSGAHPDLTGLRLLVRAELNLGNFDGAVQAQQRIIALLGDEASATDHSELADLMAAEAGGYVSPEAENAAERALKLDGNDAAARYYIGLMHGQTGRPDLAVSIWSRLVGDLPDDSPILADLRFSLPAAAAMAGIAIDIPAPRPPTLDAETVAAAEAMSEAERREFIAGMVTSLQERLYEEGGTVSEWSRLIRSQFVLGDDEGARLSFERAREQFADSPGDLRLIAEATGIREQG